MGLFGTRIKGVSDKDLLDSINDIIALAQHAEKELEGYKKYKDPIHERRDLIAEGGKNSVFRSFCDNAIARLNHLREEKQAAMIKLQERMKAVRGY